MSLVDRINIETRTIGGVPWQPWRNPYWRFNIGGPVHPSREVQGQESVLGLAAVYGSVRFIADQIASLPIKVYRRKPDGTSARVYSSMLLGNEVSGGGPQVPGEEFYDWFFAGSASALLHGTAWGLVTNRSGIPGPDGQGLPTGIAWLPPDRMSVQDDEQQPENPLRARIYYNGRQMDRSQLITLKAFSVAGRVEGISPIRAFAALISQGLQALDYSQSWFANGGFPPGTFRNINEEVDQQQARQIRTTLTDTIRMRQPLVFGRDWEYTPISVPLNEAIFIQGMQLNATQVAAIYGVQPWRVGGTRADGLTYSNVTQNQLDELQTTLRPWLRRWEHLLTSLLPATQYAKFDTDEFLRMDPHTRNEVYQIQRNIGTRTATEIRADDDRPPLTGGDDPIPLLVWERMASTTRTMPKAIVPLIEFEADHVADTLETMEKEHPELVNPMTAGAPPLQSSPEQYLGRLMTQVRGHDDWGRPSDPASAGPKVLASFVAQQVAQLRPGQPVSTQDVLAKIKDANTIGELDSLLADLVRMPSESRPDPASTPVSRETSRMHFGPDPNFRASNENRAEARALLAAHAKAGRLQPAELDERSRKAGEAVTCGDLDTLFADLPVIEKAASAPQESRSEEHDQPLFGPAALALLHGRAEFNGAALAATNGKVH